MTAFNVYKKTKGLCVSLIALMLITMSMGCSSTSSDSTWKKQNNDLFFETWKLRAQESKGHSPAPQKKSNTLRRAKSIGVVKQKVKPEKPLPTHKVSLKMENENVGLVLRTLARGVAQNIIISSKISGNINIDIKNAPWNEAFRSVLHTQGLTYTWEGSILRVMTIADMERDLKVSSIKERQKSTFLKMEQVEPLYTQVIKIDYTDAKKLADNLKKMLTKNDNQERGYIVVDNHTNSLIVQGIYSDLKRIISVVNELDRPTPQILIEADIVETSRDIARNLGIKWGLDYTGKSNRLKSVGATVNTINSVQDYLGGLALQYGITNKLDLTMELAALEESGKLNIISRPSITTLDNQIATTSSGSKIPFVTSIDKEDDEIVKEIEYEKAELELKIKPHVIDNNYLKMEIVVTKNEPDFSQENLTYPLIRTRMTQTTLIVEDSETIVISGLSKSLKQDSSDGVPVLKNIPGLGWLFKNNGKQDSMEEVLIFITPHILKQKMAESNRFLENKDIPLIDDSDLLNASDK